MGNSMNEETLLKYQGSVFRGHKVVGSALVEEDLSSAQIPILVFIWKLPSYECLTFRRSADVQIDVVIDVHITSSQPRCLHDLGLLVQPLKKLSLSCILHFMTF
jgi:hypothetical protein